jgi:hypothetical protein
VSLFHRRERLSPDFIAVPAEQTVVPAEARIAAVDTLLRDAAAMRPWDGETRAELNWLLDQRNKIRPGRPRPVPAIPGPIDSIIDNRRENP